MKKIVSLLFVLFSVMSSFAQFDSEFWFAPPYANPIHDANNQFRFVFSTSTLASTVTITQPANPSFTPITFNIAANSNYISTIPATSANVDQSNATSNRGFKIMATNPVFCYYEVYTQPGQTYPVHNTELFALKGKNALGIDFFIPMQNYLPNHTYAQQCYSYFSVIASEDNTIVTITPTQALLGHGANVPFNITLNTGQFYTARAAGFTALAHPAGSKVVANKKVAITYYDDSMSGVPFGGCADIGGDQIVPTTLLGNTYVAIQGYAYQYQSSGTVGPYDPVFILATQNNTEVYINSGGTPITTLNAGQTYKYQFTLNPMTTTTNSAVYITTSNPVYVSQVSGFGCEVGYSILPTMDCRGSRAVSLTRSQGDSYYVTLVTSINHISNFTFNGSSTVITAADFLDVPGTGGAYKFARKLLTSTVFPVGASAIIQNSSGDFHLGVINGGDGTTCKFGYFSDFAQYPVIGSSLTSDTICEGDSISFEIINSFTGASYTWTHLESAFQQGPSPVPAFSILNANPGNSGTYLIEGNFGACEMQSDTLKVVVLPKPEADFSSITSCINNPSSFENLSIGADAYQWDFGDGVTSTQTDPSHTYTLDGPYNVQLIATSAFGCIDTMVHNIEIIPGIQVYDTATFCPNGTYTFYDQVLSVSGDYDYFIDGPDCDTIVFLRLDQIEASVNITQEPYDFCEHYQAMLFAESDFPNFIWSTGETTPQIVVLSAGTYTVTASLDDCSVTNSFKILPCEQYVYLPNTITPGEQDGLNDFFSLHPAIIPQVVEFELFIFDRWGALVFFSIDPAFVWDGKVGGKVASNSVFTYRMQVRFDKTKTKQIFGSLIVL